MGLLAFVAHPLRRLSASPLPQHPNDHIVLLELIAAQNFSLAAQVWQDLGRPGRRHLLRLAGYRQGYMAFDHAILKFGRYLLTRNHVAFKVGDLNWQPHWLMYANPALSLVLLH
jgi:hypothetical protein